VNLDFSSDNASGAATEVLLALGEANTGTAHSYGEDEWTKKLERAFAERFEREVTVLPVFTGTAANALALAAVTPPWGAVMCHAESHIHTDECGAPEQFTQGAKLVAVHGPNGKITPALLDDALSLQGLRGVHSVQPAALSLTQATELGTVYSKQELATLGALAKRRSLRLHVDGARFANALVTLGCTPAEATWKVGVDLLSFGGTKNGAFGAEAILCFDKELGKELEFRRKRAGQLSSKMRFVSAQLLALLEKDLWLRLARRANTMAKKMSDELAALGFPPAFPTEANEVFTKMPKALIEHLHAKGAHFYEWTGIPEKDGLLLVRLVTAFGTRDEDVDGFIALVRQAPRGTYAAAAGTAPAADPR
jgi:threonine aldolase